MKLRNIMSLIGLATALTPKRNPTRAVGWPMGQRPSSISRAERSVRKKRAKQARASRKSNR